MQTQKAFWLAKRRLRREIFGRSKIKITANGRERPADDSQTVAEFIESLGINPRRCVVEHNSNAMRYEEFAKVALSEGDVLEVMQIVAGG